MKCQIYIVSDRQPLEVTAFSTNLSDIPAELSGDVIVGKWKVQFDMWEGLSQSFIDYEDEEYPISVHHDFAPGNTQELRGARLSRLIGGGFTLEFIFNVATIIPVDTMDIHAVFTL